VGALVSKWLFFKVKSAMVQLYHGENVLHFDEMMKTIKLVFVFLLQSMQH
jgi:hypothetical protein